MVQAAFLRRGPEAVTPGSSAGRAEGRPCPVERVAGVDSGVGKRRQSQRIRSRERGRQREMG